MMFSNMTPLSSFSIFLFLWEIWVSSILTHNQTYWTCPNGQLVGWKSCWVISGLLGEFQQQGIFSNDNPSQIIVMFSISWIIYLCSFWKFQIIPFNWFNYLNGCCKWSQICLMSGELSFFNFLGQMWTKNIAVNGYQGTPITLKYYLQTDKLSIYIILNISVQNF